MTHAAHLAIVVSANTRSAVRGIARVQAQLGATQAAGNKALGAITAFAKGSALAAGGGIAYSIKKAADFESQLDSLGSVSGATGRQMERFRKQAMKAGAVTKFSALDAAQAQTELAKGGLSVAQIMRGGLRSSLALAAAGEMELAEAAAATANAINLFGLKGRDSIKVADMLAEAANATTADVSDFAIALTQGGSVAKSAGLSFRETVLALEALAKSGIKNSDAGTSLKTALIQLIKPTEKQAELANKLNLSFVDQEGKIKSLAGISTMLRDRLGGMTDAQRTATLATLAGTDGVRTLTALYDAGAPRLNRWEKGLAKQGTAAEVAARKQDNFRGKLENLQGSVETVAISIGSKMLPALTRAAERVTDIINDPKLTSAEKFQRLAQMIGDAFARALPIIADKAAQAAPVAAGAFVKGWLAAGIWGRLVIGGWLLAKLGGFAAFTRLGAQAGTAMGAGVAAGTGTGLLGKLKGKGGLAGIAALVAAVVGPDLVRVFTDTGDKARWAATEYEFAAKRMERLQRAGNMSGLRKAAADAKVTAKALGESGRPLMRLAQEFERTGAQAQAVGSQIARMGRNSSESIRELRGNVRLNTRLIRNALGEDTAAGRKAMVENFNAAARNVRRSMREGTLSTREGTREIERLMILALRNMGFTKKQALNVRKGRDPSSGRPLDSAAPGQRGMYIDQGAPSGDTVPAILERGEYVLNRNAVRKIGKKQLDQLNFATAPRFQQGGIIELLHPFNDPAGHGGANSHLHIAMSNVAALVALGRRLQRLGWLVGEHPAFGGVGGMHDPRGYHYSGQAIDVNWPDAGAEGAKISAILPMLTRLAAGKGIGPSGGLVAPKLARMLVEGPDSPLKSLVQGALDNSRAGAQQTLEKVAGSIEGAESGVFTGFSGSWVRVLEKIAAARGWSVSAWKELVRRESGGNPEARNPSSGAFGLGQFLGATAQAYAKYGALSHDPVKQIEAMARYISDRYGTPSAALAFHDANNWYKQGGIVGLRFGGSPVMGRPLGGGARGPSPKKEPAKPRGLPRQLERTLGILRKSAKTEVRSRALRDLLGRIKKVGLPANLQKNLDVYERDAATFGDMADRASQLTVEPLDESMEPILGTVGGLTEADWLNKQLETLFAFRNALIRAQEIVVQRREMITKLIEQARERLQQVADAIRAAAKVRHALEKEREEVVKRLEKAREHPKRNREQIKLLRARAMQLHDQIGGIDKQQDRRARVRDKLKDKIIPALNDKRSALNTARGELLQSLDTVQGPGSPMERLSSLPEIGVLGGDIFTVQMRLRELAQPRERITDTVTETAEESESAELLRELLREANLRTAVSQAQYKVLRDFPTYMGAFAQGGVALVGERGPELAHMPSGTRIHSAADTASMLASNNVSVQVVVYEGEKRADVFVNDQRIEAVVERVNRRTARAGARALPGRGGGF